MNTREALDRLRQSDHEFLSLDAAEELQLALGIEEPYPKPDPEVDTRWTFKGLTVNKPDGYLDLHEFRRWVRQNWWWIQPKSANRITQTFLTDDLWMQYTRPVPLGGLGLPGIPYAFGVDATDLAQWACRQLGVPYTSYIGRGFQLRGCVDALEEHFGLEEEHGKEQG